MCDNPAWRQVGDGVVRLTFIKEDGRSVGCSAALLNDEANSGTPYIYTAHHCLSTQSVASTVEIDYFYQRNLCADDPDNNTATRLGSTLLTTGDTSYIRQDFTLLRASTAPPDGVTLLGWTTADIALGTPVTGIHHPRLDFKRISFGDIIAQTIDKHLHPVDWSSGIIQAGSSGSPAIINGPDSTSAQVIGTLSLANHLRCDITQLAYYHKLSHAWPFFQHFLNGGPLPNLTVDTVGVSTSIPNPGVPFTINVIVRNPRNEASATTMLRYVRSTDATITAADTELTTEAVGALAAGTFSSIQSGTVSIPTKGTWWVGACVVAMGSGTATDNCSTGVPISVTAPPVPAPTLPDLIVDGVSVSQSNVEAGASFTINATARNSGDGAAAATTLSYYRSDDRTISTTDTQLATDPISGLAPSGASSQSAAVSIADTGNWWVGACIGPVNGETARDNNCSDGVQVTVTQPPAPALPDLIVDGVGVSQSNVEAGASFTINATARNSGDGAAAATTLSYYRSDDRTISTTDTQLATDPISGLAPSGTSSQSAAVSIANTGNRWVGACVGPVNGETARGNNCSDGVQVTVTEPPAPALPDLIVDGVGVSQSNVEAGASFTINATARNSGNGASPATTLRYYRSADDTITTDDSQLATDRVSALAAGATSVESAAVSIANTGTWWIGACVATVADESNTANNCSTGVSVSVTAPPVVVPTSPDLLVDTVSVSATSVQTGVSFTINATARNSGDGASAATTLRYYRSANNTITTTDTPIGTDAVGGLSAGGSSRESTTVSIAIARTWWVGACVEAVNGEVARTNNCSTAVQVTVTAPPVVVPTLPDLTVDNVSVSESTVETDVSFTINATVRNSGNGAASAATLSYYRSADSTITTADTEVATDPVDGLAPSRSSQQSATVSITNTGTWWVGACVGTVNGETETNNNCSVGVEVTVTAPALPDLTVDGVSVSASTVETDVSFTINATARNPGTGTSPATTLRYFRSDDATITTADTEVATDPVGPLAPGGSAQQNAEVAITGTGTWWVGACISTVSDETETGNNCSDSVQVTVTAPDLTVDSISVAESSVEADAAFTINATVQNQGTAASVATTLHYYGSNDSTITASDTQLATRSVEALAADTSSQQSAEVVIADAGSYWVGACVAEVNNESATDNNCSSGVPVTVTARPDNNDGILPAIIQLLLLP